MENEKRKELLKRLKDSINEKERKELYRQINEKRDPTIGEIVDGYKSFIYDLGPGFLEIAEKYNQCIQIAKTNELIGNARLKVRIKDFSSSSINTDIKVLDDVFGAEIVTATEFEKEVLMLFNHIAFTIDRDKKYNKKNGYAAYHCMGDFLPKEGDLQEMIKEKVENEKTREYVYSKSEPNYDDKRKLVSVFPNLSEYILDPKNLDELSRVLEEMLKHIKTTDMPQEQIPAIEFHFLTTEKEQEALRGVKANHSNYKKTNTKLIEQYFKEGRLIRGINAPWKFIGGEDELKLQDFYTTLIENWPFLKDEIVKKRNQGVETDEKLAISKFDAITASQFPFLRKYLDGNFEYPEEKNKERWGLLKALIIANRITRYDEPHSLKDGLIEVIDKI